MIVVLILLIGFLTKTTLLPRDLLNLDLKTNFPFLFCFKESITKWMKKLIKYKSRKKWKDDVDGDDQDQENDG